MMKSPRILNSTVIAFLAGFVLAGCQHINVKQLAYEVLRQEDCLRNELEDFCTRTFASEYREYERIRQDFIRSVTQPQWRVDQSRLTKTASIDSP